LSQHATCTSHIPDDRCPTQALQRVTGEVFRAVAGGADDAGLPADVAVAVVKAIDRRLAEIEDDDG
jgi:hypothetical protein